MDLPPIGGGAEVLFSLALGRQKAGIAFLPALLPWARGRNPEAFYK